MIIVILIVAKIEKLQSITGYSILAYACSCPSQACVFNFSAPPRSSCDLFRSCRDLFLWNKLVSNSSSSNNNDDDDDHDDHEDDDDNDNDHDNDNDNDNNNNNDNDKHIRINVMVPNKSTEIVRKGIPHGGMSETRCF